MSEILPAITAHALALAVEPCEGSLQAAGRCNKAGTTRVSEVGSENQVAPQLPVFPISCFF